MAKKREQVADHIRTEQRKVKLPCRLTESERIEKGGALAAVVVSIANLENDIARASDEFRSFKKDTEETISGFKCRQSELSKVITDAAEERDVICVATFDYEAGTVTVRRMDTGEVIEDRDMQGLEKQMQLDWEKANRETSVTIPCEPCKGTGITPDNCRCEACRGAGEVEIEVHEPEETK